MKKVFNLILLFLTVFSLISCGDIEETPVEPVIPIEPDDSGNNNTNTQEKVEFKVSLIYNKGIFAPEEDEKITVIWRDDANQYSSQIAEDGFARKELDGTFNVYLENAPDGYAYNPNIYTADNDNPIVEIELFKISRISKGSGTGLYNCYEMSSIGTYNTKITSSTKKTYYQYQPTKAGYYSVESYVNVYDDLINPLLDVYNGTFAAKWFDETIDDGGSSLPGGYTKNFKWVVKLSEQQIGNVFTFVVYANTKTGEYPVNIVFKIDYLGDYYEPITVSKVMQATQIKEQTPDFSPGSYTYINSDGGTGSYYAGVTNGTGLLDGTNYKYNEETGYWHVYNKTTGEFGPILCAKITKPCAYYDESLNLIESHGNKNLTVSNGTENYKQFIENEYAAVCNSDGVCYVTMELMEFLQKFSISQRLFFDGNGFVESTGVFALEEDQWLFACGYYLPK